MMMDCVKSSGERVQSSIFLLVSERDTRPAILGRDLGKTLVFLSCSKSILAEVFLLGQSDARPLLEDLNFAAAVGARQVLTSYLARSDRLLS